MRKYGIVSYNLHCNFTNYGSALQQYALQRVVNEISPDEVQGIVMDYCPDCLSTVNVLNPFGNLWDKDEETRRECELTLPAIKENYDKFTSFFESQYPLSKGRYTSSNFNDSKEVEELDGYICGSDTIWCIREFDGFDDGYYANYDCMKHNSVSYAASFGDVDWTESELDTLVDRMHNFNAIGIREDGMVNYISENTDVDVQRVVDPTLLLTGDDYQCITNQEDVIGEPYILMYSRRYNPAMEAYTEKMAEELGCRIVDISLRATNKDKGHIMRYDAGVEEFLGLCKHAKLVVTNSFHGLIFAAQMHTDFVVFSREQASTKIDQLLALMGLEDQKMIDGSETTHLNINYDKVESNLAPWRAKSLAYLRRALEVED